MDILATLLPIILLFVFLYFLMILPQKKAQKQRDAMLHALKAGDKVETVSRVYGTISKVVDDDLILDISETSESVKIRINIYGVARVIPRSE